MVSRWDFYLTVKKINNEDTNLILMHTYLSTTE